MTWGKSNCPIPELRHRRRPVLFTKSLHKPLLLQPEQAGVRPRMRMCERGVVVESQTVPVFLVDVQIKRHAGLPQRLGEHQAVFHRNRFVFESLPDETRRRVRRHLQFVGKQPDQFRRRMGAEQIGL